jgi:L-ascorbate oxidase
MRRFASPRSFLFGILALAGAGIAYWSAAGAAAPPPRLLANPPVATATGANRIYNIDVRMVRNRIYNPATQKFDDVNLRNYFDLSGRQPNTLVGPTIEAHPGDTLKVNLRNMLVGDPDCKQEPHNTPKCFDGTNLHTHGLWVTPEGFGDSVLIEIKPKRAGAPDPTPVPYKFEIPKEHPAGTFWYHSHVHGSTALQVASGLSGALIIRGDRKPTNLANGDIDTLLAPLNPLERIMLFQQIAYSCGRDGVKPVWNCTGKTGTVDDYNQISGGKWNQSGRFTSINGVVMPTLIGSVVGQIERWRMIHGGIANTINLFIREEAPNAPSPDGLTAAQTADWVERNCTGPVVHQFIIASDGITRSRIVDRGENKKTTLQPGYRDDALIVFPKPGKYCVINTAAPAQESISEAPQSRRLLGQVVAMQGPFGDIADQRQFLEGRLVSAAQNAGYDPVIADRVTTQLRTGLALASFTPHKDLSIATSFGRQELSFYMDDDGTKFHVSTKLNDQGEAYNGKVVRRFKFDGIDEWHMGSVGFSHPFHIHVNPFQIQAIINDKTGKDVSVDGEGDDTEYADLKYQWKDTILIKQGYTIITRTRYERFPGVFVLHCHILDHEDKGMMEKVRICPPGGCTPSPDDPMTDGPMSMGH